MPTTTPRDQRAITLYIQILGAPSWPHPHPPTHYHRLWQTYLRHGTTRHYPWDDRHYPEQRQADMQMCRTIHHIYQLATGTNVIQTTIQF